MVLCNLMTVLDVDGRGEGGEERGRKEGEVRGRRERRGEGRTERGRENF